LQNHNKIISDQEGQLGIYFHWPFCLSKCPYCDFNTHISNDVDHARWAAAYVRSLEHYAEFLKNRTVGSVFFGGGTPSLMAPETAAAVIDKIHTLWPVSKNVEITLEANPTSVETNKLEAFSKSGINRVSLGVQSLNDSDLKFLGRQHSAKDAIKAIDLARRVFDRVSFDLIYARPGQTLQSWEDELIKATDFADGHLSLYQLTIERNTPFYFDHEQKLFSVPNEDDAARFYNLTQDILEARGLPGYEVSNHASAGQESRHNLVYWRAQDYIGIGPGAHGRITQNGSKYATRDHHAPEVWLARVEADGHGAHPYEALDGRNRFLEALMMGLRLREGLPVARLNDACGGDWRSYIDDVKMQKVQDAGWLSLTESGARESLQLSREGMLRINALIPYILK
jgi:oxygen-independent coproporphyrinogen-3 oxidase